MKLSDDGVLLCRLVGFEVPKSARRDWSWKLSAFDVVKLISTLNLWRTAYRALNYSESAPIWTDTDFLRKQCIEWCADRGVENG